MTGKNLEAMLLEDADFLQKVSSLKFAHGVYLTFCNREWINQEGDRWICSWRYAGGLVAQARNVGESYLDFYMRDMDGSTENEPSEEDFAAFREIIHRLGWREVTVDDEVRDGKKIIQMLDEAGKKEPGPTPEWFRFYELPDGRKHDEGTLLGRMDRAAAEGRISEEDFLWMRARCFFTKEAAEQLKHCP